ncbi:MAG TPA: hypothetical protein VGI39_17845 [Polyangiaceae bacterium]|jgi:hypothetical protein
MTSATAAFDDDLVLLKNDAMRARRRAQSVALLWVWEAIVALLAAWPVAAGVDALYGQHPHGDGALWEPGGFFLADLFRREPALLSSASAFFLATVVLGGLTGLWPLGALLVSMGHATRERRAPGLGASLLRGAELLPTFGALFALLGALLVITLAGARALTFAMSHHFAAGQGKALADQLGLAAGLSVAAVAIPLLILQDLARAAAARFRVSALPALRWGMRTIARAPGTLVWAWGWRMLARGVPLFVGALVASRIGGRSGPPLLGLFLVHQLVVASSVALRASWLAAALRAVDAGD